ncbi:MAG: HAMP domain-containing protein [bacterium]|nr:HAMP domain-containing protein [bacterium]
MIFPLRLKLAILASVLLIAGVGTVSVLVFEQSSEAIENEARKRGEFLTRQFADNARDPLLLEDDLVLAKLVQTVAEESEILVARVLDANGAVIVSSRVTEPERRERMTTVELVGSGLSTRGIGGRLMVASQMSFRDVDLGEVQIIMDLDAVISPVVGRARRDILLASGALLIVGLALAFAISGRITRPLQRLRMAVNALAVGDLSARVAITSRDEIGVLARAFNSMSESLSQKARIETAFRRYVSDHVLRQVTESSEEIALEGEQREVTVIFIDIRKFTRLTRSIGPQRIVSFLNEAFDLITGRLLEHGATVDKYIGDAILAYIGAPIETFDHPERAVAAAIAVQRSVDERNSKYEASGQSYVRLEVGIGIHTGIVVVGNIGSELKMDYTVIGDPVNVANRLQGRAAAGEIIMTGEVYRRLGGRIAAESLGALNLEGMDVPTVAYKVDY